MGDGLSVPFIVSGLPLVLKIQTTIRQESAVNSTARNTEKDHLLPNTVSQKDEKAHTARLNDTAIPHLILKNQNYRNTA